MTFTRSTLVKLSRIISLRFQMFFLILVKITFGCKGARRSPTYSQGAPKFKRNYSARSLKHFFSWNRFYGKILKSHFFFGKMIIRPARAPFNEFFPAAIITLTTDLFRLLIISSYQEPLYNIQTIISPYWSLDVNFWCISFQPTTWIFQFWKKI